MIVRLRDKARLVERPRTGQALLLYPERALDLNASARQVLELLDGARSVDQVVQLLAERHPDTPPEVVHRYVEDFIEQLRERALLELVSPCP